MTETHASNESACLLGRHMQQLAIAESLINMGQKIAGHLLSKVMASQMSFWEKQELIFNESTVVSNSSDPGAVATSSGVQLHIKVECAAVHKC